MMGLRTVELHEEISPHTPSRSILVNVNLTAWKAAIYCTVFAGDIVLALR
jgi:hypothetical protein